uniref:BCL2 associated agonist of cell death b n=2 Tax=Hucho hucho TaxID=62062 RepID=A0A4W5JR00_9TELE
MLSPSPPLPFPTYPLSLSASPPVSFPLSTSLFPSLSTSPLSLCPLSFISLYPLSPHLFPLSLHPSSPPSHSFLVSPLSLTPLPPSSSVDVSMAQMFTISDSESEPSEEVGETEKDQLAAGKGMTGGPIGHALTVPEMRLAGEGRLRMNSESQAQELQGRGPGVEGMPTDGASFRVRSQSAPPALWAAKKYGRQLRRMSDEFDTWLDKGEMRRVKSAGAAKQMTKSPSWWAYLFSHKETETEHTPTIPPRSSE